MQVLMTTSPAAWVACPPRSPNTVNPSSRTMTIGSGMLHQALRHHLTSTDSHDHPSSQPPTLERRVLSAAPEGRRVNGPLGVWIDEAPLVFQRLADDLPWPRHARAVHGASIEAKPEDDGDSGLETVEAVGAGFLRGLVMGRMICCDHIDHPFDQRLAQRITVVCGAQRRIDISV